MTSATIPREAPRLLPPPLPAVPPNALAALGEPAATLLCIAVVLAAPLVTGAPLMFLLRGRRALQADDWLLAPFVGLGALVLGLQNAVYLDVPVARSSPYAWALAGLLLAGCARSDQVRASLRTFPRALYALALGAYLVQAAALLNVGARHWMGRLWEDEFSYTGMAQFVHDEPFSLDVEATGQRPWLFRVLRPSLGRFYLPVGLKENRLGQSVLQAFHVASVGGDAKTLFGPTILLGAPLLALGVGLLAGRLELRPRATWAAAWLGALAPGFTLLHLESFLSHALVLAFLPVWLVVLDELGREPTLGSGGAALFVLSFGVATYGELWLPLLALAAASLGLSAWRARAPVRGLLTFGLLVVAPFVLNPRFMPMLLLTTVMGSTAAMHTAIYPWAYGLEGAGRLWWGDLVLLGPAWWRTALGALGLLATLAGLAGASVLALRRRAAAAPALRVSLLCLALGPLPLWIEGQHPYQFYKLVQTALPALVVGLVALATGAVSTRARRFGAALLALLLGAATLASASMVWRTASLVPEARSNAGLFLTAEARELQTRLETLRGTSLVVGRGFFPLQNAWIAWFARFNDVWLSEPFLGRDRLERSPGAARLLDLERLPWGALVLTRRDDRSFARPPAVVAWSNAAWELWRPLAGPWVTLFDVDRPGAKTPRLDVSRPTLHESFGLGRAELRLRLLAGQTGHASITLDVRPRHAGVTLHARGCAPDVVALDASRGALRLLCDVRQGFGETRLHASTGGALAFADGLDLRVTGVDLATR